MNQLVRTTLTWSSTSAGGAAGSSTSNGMDRSSLDLDFGCPFGCDDNGRHVRDLHAEIKEVTEVVPCEPG